MSRTGYGLVTELDFRPARKRVRGGSVECPFCDEQVRGDKFTEHALVCEDLRAEVRGEQAFAASAGA